LAQVGRMVADRRRVEQYPVARGSLVIHTRRRPATPCRVRVEWRRHEARSTAACGRLAPHGSAALIPNLVLANALFNDSSDALALLVQPIPMWAAVIGLVAFPVTMAVAELPTYYGLILPRLQETWSNRWIALCVVVAWHAAQHVTLPLIFDVRFIAWRFFMFLPLAFLVAVAVQRRGSVLPYLMVVHGLLDTGAAYLVLMSAN